MLGTKLPERRELKDFQSPMSTKFHWEKISSVKVQKADQRTLCGYRLTPLVCVVRENGPWEGGGGEETNSAANSMNWFCMTPQQKNYYFARSFLAAC
jgi:hypothetical protein